MFVNKNATDNTGDELFFLFLIGDYSWHRLFNALLNNIPLALISRLFVGPAVFHSSCNSLRVCSISSFVRDLLYGKSWFISVIPFVQRSLETH